MCVDVRFGSGTSLADYTYSPQANIYSKTNRLRIAGVVAPTSTRAATPLTCKASQVGRRAFFFVIFVFGCRGTGLGLPLLRFREFGGLAWSFGLVLGGSPAFRIWSDLLAFCFALLRAPILTICFFAAGFCCSNTFFLTPIPTPTLSPTCTAGSAAEVDADEDEEAFTSLILASTSWR